MLADVSALTLRQSNIGDMGKERVYIVRGHADLRGNMSSGQKHQMKKLKEEQTVKSTRRKNITERSTQQKP